MDSLLSQHIEELPDERTALFGLIDRFSERIYSFQKDYADLELLASSDINSRKKDKEKSLAIIDDEYESNRKKLEFDHKNQLGIIDSTNARNTAETKKRIEEEERKCQEQINKAKNGVDSANRSEDARFQSYSEIIKDLNRQIDRVEKILGKAKLDKIIKALKLDLAPINDVNNAKDYLSDSAIRNAEELVRRIQIITESLPRRIFRNNRRTAYIKQLLEIRENAKNALGYIRNSIQKKQNKRQDDYIKTTGFINSTCNRNKQNIIARQEELTKEYKEQIVKENQKYKKNSAKLDADYETKRSQLEKHHDQQISNAIKNWKEKIRLIQFEFEKQIEEEFPAQEMNAWINKFWYHPRRLDQYKIVCNKVNRNLLLGEAQIDISDWLSGKTSDVVRKVLLKYPTLFGVSAEQRKLSYDNSAILLPYSISIEKGDSLLLLYEDNDFESAKGILNEIALRLLNSVPACLMRY